MKKTIALLLVGIVVLGIWGWNSKSGQDWLLDKAMTAAMQRTGAMNQYDGLKVFMCGTSSPLPAKGRAQACVAVLADESLYLIDAGAGSNLVASLALLPMAQLEGMFVTHYHSDHIAEIYEFNLSSWVAGRPEPLTIFGPEGISDFIEGLNMAYGRDRAYRVEHHGAELLPPELGILRPQQMNPGTTVSVGDDLLVTSFLVNHDPVRPAVGYRFDYRGRSVVVSGDAIVTPGLIEASRGADLLVQDVLSLPIIETLQSATPDPRLEKILGDIQDYHAHTSHMSELVEKSGVRQLALYHLVPAPQNALFEKLFLRDLPDGSVLSEDGMMFELPADSETIRIIDP